MGPAVDVNMGVAVGRGTGTGVGASDGRGIGLSDEVGQKDKSIAAESLAEEEIHTNAEKYTESAAWHSVEASDEQYQSLVMFTELSKVESWSHSQSTS